MLAVMIIAKRARTAARCLGCGALQSATFDAACPAAHIFSVLMTYEVLRLPRSNRWSPCRYPRIYGEGPVAELAADVLERYWPTPLLTPLCQTVASCERTGQTAALPRRLHVSEVNRGHAVTAMPPATTNAVPCMQRAALAKGSVTHCLAASMSLRCGPRSSLLSDNLCRAGRLGWRRRL